MVPLMISTLITTLSWIALAAPNAGFINAVARTNLGIPTLFNIYSVPGIVLVMTLHYASFAFIQVYAALRSLDASMEEASYMLGANPLRTAMRMTFPLIWPALAASFLLIFIFVSENFSVPTILGSSIGFHTLASSIFYDMTGEPSKPTLAATSGTMLLWIAVLATMWQRRIAGRARRYVTIAGKGSRHRLVDLGVWKYAVTALVILYLLAAVGLPYATLILASLLKFVTPHLTPALFTTANYQVLFRWDRIGPIRNSLFFAGIIGLGMTFLYVFIAYLITRSRGWFARILDYTVIVPTVVPALVLGVAFVWTFVGVTWPIYGTAWILVIAYFVRFIGQGVRQSRAAFVQVADELPEAARICGATSLRAFRDIVLPLLKPSLMSLWTILFILIFMEISMTIILYSPDTETLSVLLCQSMAVGHFTAAFAVAVIQATIAFAVLSIANKLFGTLRVTLDQ